MTRTLRRFFGVALLSITSSLTMLVSAGVAAAQDPVVFGDPALKAAVEAQLGVADPTPTDMLGLTSLSAPSLGISDLTGLEYAVNLTVLRLDGNQIDDISPLSGLNRLWSLVLRDNRISDVSDLPAVRSWKGLNLSGNQIRDISPLVRIHLWQDEESGELNVSDNPLDCWAFCVVIPAIGHNNPRGTIIHDPMPEDCVCASGAPVEFGDAALKAAVEATLGVADPTPTDMLQLTFLRAPSLGISDLTGIEYAVNLNVLFLDGNQIDDVSPLSGLNRLWTLALRDNQISDVSGIPSATSWKGLFLSGNQIRDLSPLMGISLWQDEESGNLDVSNNPLDCSAFCVVIPAIREANPVTIIHDPMPEDCDCDAEEPVFFADPALKAAVEAELRVSDPTPADMLLLGGVRADSSGISDLTGLEYARNLGGLWLNDNEISDLSPLAGMTNLDVIMLSRNLISDLSPLAGSTRLGVVVLDGNQISDVSPLSDITERLTVLVLSDNQITDIAALPRSALPFKVLALSSNQVTDISPLLNLTFHSGDEGSDLRLTDNPLNCPAFCTVIPAIREAYPLLLVTHDPMPEDCDCDSSRVFIPGDCNTDGNLDVSDGICIFGVLFLGNPSSFPCGDGSASDPGNLALLDWQPDGGIDISDGIDLLQFLFLGGAPHPLSVPEEERTGLVEIPGCR